MRLLKTIIALVVAGALCAGVLIYALKEEGGLSGGAPGSVRINEFMASNGSTLPDDTGSYSDWIELYNPTDQPISLSGLGLSDDNASVKWVFPNISLAPGGYVIVFASGSSSNTESALHANFKLTASGGGIYLTDSSGKIIDQIEYKDQVQNVSMGRTVEDPSAWQLYERPTPGYSNDEAGFEAFEQSRYADGTSLIITEVMASNRITIADNKGSYSDYIEIYNAGTEPINLLGYGLSDDAKKVLAWRFPEVTIQPGQHLLVFASGEDLLGNDLENGYIHTSFRIASYEETIVLSTPLGLILDEVTVSESQSDMAYARVMGGEAYTDDFEQTSRATPGYPNSEEGYQQYMATNPIAHGPIVISEVMASNNQYLEESDGGFYDWIELYNQSQETINLSGYGLTDNPGNPAKWRLPDDISLAPGEYKVVLASGQGVKKNYIHTNFKLSASGDVLALFDANGVLQDKYVIEPVPRGVSIGRTPGSDGIFYFQTPTPGAANTSPSEGIVSLPTVNTVAGSYDGAQQIELSCATPGASIHYTLDGTVPSQSSQAYSGPITVSQTGMIRARAFRDGYIESATQTETYFIGETHGLPLISIVTDPKLLFDPTSGIYELGPNATEITGSSGHYQNANYSQRGRNSERPASFEVFDESGKRAFVQDIGIRIQGGFSRDHAQKSFSIFARSSYGKNSMEYAFFDDRPFTEYKSLVLRQGGQDQKVAKIKEIVTFDLVKDKGFNFIMQAYKPYVVYINGEYWGVYFMMEKRNEYFIAQHEGVSDPKNMNVLWITGTALHGTNEGYKELINYIGSHDMSLQENYDYLAARLDTDSFMDLMINQIYIANTDYGNIQYYQILPDGKWKQIYYDFCWTFGNSEFPEGNHPTLEKRLESAKAGSSVFTALLAYKPWKDAFVERFAWALKEVYNTEHVLSVIDAAADLVRDEMPAERAKFGGSVQSWEAHINNMKNFVQKRNAFLVQHLRSVLSLSDAQKQMLDDAIK